MPKHSVVIGLSAVLLALACLVPTGALAAQADPLQPQASNYLNLYDARISLLGGGKLQISFVVRASDSMDELGALSITVYESVDNVSYTSVKTFSSDEYRNMMTNNDYMHSSDLTYYGIPGRYYKCHVCFRGSRNGQGDTRYLWTSTQRAT